MNANVLHKMNVATDKIEVTKIKTKRKAIRVLRSWKLKVAVVLLSLAILGGVCLMAFYNISKFYDNNKVIFNVPIEIKFRPLIEIKPRVVKKASVMPIEEVKKVEKPLVAKTEFEIVNAQKHGQILWKIYQLESQRGLADGCRQKGNGFGGFGVMDNDGVACYPTFSKAVERAEYWLSKLNPDKNLASALCQYNLGLPNLVNCTYYQNFLSL